MGSIYRTPNNPWSLCTSVSAIRSTSRTDAGKWATGWDQQQKIQPIKKWVAVLSSWKKNRADKPPIRFHWIKCGSWPISSSLMLFRFWRLSFAFFFMAFIWWDSLLGWCARGSWCLEPSIRGSALLLYITLIEGLKLGDSTDDELPLLLTFPHEKTAVFSLFDFSWCFLRKTALFVDGK